MRELSQKPDYEMMWKVECELNKELQEQNKIFKEALEKISTNTVEVGFYVEPTWSAKIAIEALVNVNDKQSGGIDE